MHSQTLPITVSATAADGPGDALRRRLIGEADMCVACGMCLPVCPTYTDARTEPESPRGRIALIRALAEGRLDPGAVMEHLDHCLQCQACETICPATVPYGRLIDGAHAYLRAHATGEGRGIAGPIAWLLRTPRRTALLSSALALYRASGARWLARRTGILRALGLEAADRLAGAARRPRGWRPFYPAIGAERGRVGLFLGCIARSADRRNLDAAISVLRKLGYGVHVPAGQGCCGAIDLHAGRDQPYQEAMARNARVFDGLEIEALIGIASGCTAVLRQRGPSSRALPPVRDINEFLVSAPWPQAVRLRPADKDVYLHTPCTLRNAIREPRAPARLLARIPGLRIHHAPADAQCCGAAGTYSLRYPETSRRLAERALAPVRALRIGLVATANIGCALHLDAAAREEGAPLRLIHPVQLLDEHLEGSGA